MFFGSEIDYGSILAFVAGDSFTDDVSVSFVAFSNATFAFDSPTASPSGSLMPSMLPSLSQMPSQTLQIITVLINFDTFSAVGVDWRILTSTDK